MILYLTAEIEIEIKGKYSPEIEARASLNILPENCSPGENSEFEPTEVTLMIPKGKGEYIKIKYEEDIENLFSYNELIQAADSKYQE